MQVLRAIESVTIGYPYNELTTNATVAPDACVGLHDQAPIWASPNAKWSDRGYVKFKLPNLPDGAAPTNATLVGVPEPSRLSHWFSPGVNEDTLIYRVTQDWSFLQGVTSVPTTTVITHAPISVAAKIPFIFSSDFDPDKRPATTWDVTGDVQMWYDDPDTNHGFALVSEHDGHHLDVFVPGEYKTFFLHCFPTTPMDLDGVLDNPADPTTHSPGLGLLIEYDSPQLAANELRTVLVPSKVPGDMYANQHHEYGPPARSGWQLMAARGQRIGKIASVPLLLTQTVPADPDLQNMLSAAGEAAPPNATYAFKSNYVVVNGHQSLPSDLRLWVKPDPFADVLQDDDRKYHLQITDTEAAPAFPGFGVSVTLPIALDSGFIAGQELNLPVSGTVEIKVPYDGLQPYSFNLQLFPPSLKYGTRDVPGIQLTPGPDAWEIEIVVPPGLDGTWLLAAINDGQYPNDVTLTAQLVACENRPNAVVYPVDGECVEIRTPPTPIPSDPTVVYTAGNVRIYSPAGFTGDCSTGNCVTKAKMGDGTAVAALIGYVADDTHWVALKGGQFDINSYVIDTTPDVRLVMAIFGEEPPITLPVLRGQFRVTDDSQGLVESIGSDIYLLVKAPLPEGDLGSGWTYGLDLSEARMWASGPVSRIVEPTEGQGQTPRCDRGNEALSKVAARGLIHLLQGKRAYVPQEPVYLRKKEAEARERRSRPFERASGTVHAPCDAPPPAPDPFVLLRVQPHVHDTVLHKASQIRGEEISDESPPVSIGVLQDAYRKVLEHSRPVDWGFPAEWNAHQVLHVQSEASKRLAHAAYKAIISQVHPDRNRQRETWATDASKRVNEAWEAVQKEWSRSRSRRDEAEG